MVSFLVSGLDKKCTLRNLQEVMTVVFYAAEKGFLQQKHVPQQLQQQQQQKEQQQQLFLPFQCATWNYMFDSIFYAMHLEVVQ